MEKLDMIECLYMTYAEKDTASRESYRGVFLDYIGNIYKQLNGNQEKIISGLAEYLQERIEKQDKYNGSDVVIACIMAGKMLQETIRGEV